MGNYAFAKAETETETETETESTIKQAQIIPNYIFIKKELIDFF
jgi:hypothetical protein